MSVKPALFLCIRAPHLGWRWLIRTQRFLQTSQSNLNNLKFIANRHLKQLGWVYLNILHIIEHNFDAVTYHQFKFRWKVGLAVWAEDLNTLWHNRVSNHSECTTRDYHWRLYQGILCDQGALFIFSHSSGCNCCLSHLVCLGRNSNIITAIVLSLYINDRLRCAWIHDNRRRTIGKFAGLTALRRALVL